MIKFLGIDYVDGDAECTDDPYALLNGLSEETVTNIVDSIRRSLKTETPNYVSEVLAIKVNRLGFLLRILDNKVVMSLDQFKKQWNELIYVLVYMSKNKFDPKMLSKAITIGENMVYVSDRDSEFVSIFFMHATE